MDMALAKAKALAAAGASAGASGAKKGGKQVGKLLKALRKKYPKEVLKGKITKGYGNAKKFASLNSKRLRVGMAAGLAAAKSIKPAKPVKSAS